MALVKCPECAAQISNKAKACPHCGATPPKKTSIVTWGIGGLVLFAVLSTVFKTSGSSSVDAPPATAAAAPAKPTQADIEINTSILIAKKIKASMKNPDSFKLDKFLIYPGGSTCFEYRGTNSFNAVVPGKAVFDSKSAAVLTSDRDKNKFVASWNAICTKAGGEERARGLNALGAV
jgi:hypothetical protein